MTTDFEPGVTYFYYDANGLKQPLSALGRTLGDTSQFDHDGGTPPFFGNDKMPFRLTITCLSAANCSPVGS